MGFDGPHGILTDDFSMGFFVENPLVISMKKGVRFFGLNKWLCRLFVGWTEL